MKKYTRIKSFYKNQTQKNNQQIKKIKIRKIIMESIKIKKLLKILKKYRNNVFKILMKNP